MENKTIKGLLLSLLLLSAMPVKALTPDEEIDAAIEDLKNSSQFTINSASNKLYQFDIQAAPKLQQKLVTLNLQLATLTSTALARPEPKLTATEVAQFNLIGRQQQNIVNVMTELCFDSNIHALTQTSQTAPPNSAIQKTIFMALSCLGANTQVRSFVEGLLNNPEAAEREKSEALLYLSRYPKLPGDLIFITNFIKPEEHILVRSTAAFVAGMTRQTQFKASINNLLTASGRDEYKLPAIYALAILESPVIFSALAVNLPVSRAERLDLMALNTFINKTDVEKLTLLDSLLSSDSTITRFIALEFISKQTNSLALFESHKVLKDSGLRKTIKKRNDDGLLNKHFSNFIFNKDYLFILKNFGFSIQGDAETPIILKGS